jgi:hypothetical protein
MEIAKCKLQIGQRKKEAGDVAASPAGADGSDFELGLGMRPPTRAFGAIAARSDRATSCEEAATRGSAGKTDSF